MRGWSILVPSLVVAAGCGTSTPHARTDVADSAGVAIVTVTELPALDDPDFEWRLKLVRSIRTEDDDPATPPRLYDPRTMARLDDGTLVVVDAAEWRLVVIDPSDSVVARFVRSGKGPGEILARSPEIWPGGDRTVWVADHANVRISRFSIEGMLLSEAPVPLVDGGIPYWRVVAGSGVLIAQRFRSTGTGALIDSLARVDPTTGALESFAPLPPRPDDWTTYTRTLFTPAQRWTGLAAGGVVTMRTDRPVVRYHSATGELVREIRLPLSPRPIMKEDRREILQEFGSISGASSSGPPPEIGSHYPITNWLYAFDDTIFGMLTSRRSRAAEDPSIPAGQTLWRLISVTGRYAGAVRFPPGFAPRWVADGRVLGVARDSLGIATIQEYLVEPPDSLRP